MPEIEIEQNKIKEIEQTLMDEEEHKDKKLVIVGKNASKCTSVV